MQAPLPVEHRGESAAEREAPAERSQQDRPAAAPGDDTDNAEGEGEVLLAIGSPEPSPPSLCPTDSCGAESWPPYCGLTDSSGADLSPPPRASPEPQLQLWQTGRSASTGRLMPSHSRGQRPRLERQRNSSFPSRDVVYTPWLPSGVGHFAVRLPQEMDVFHQFVCLTQEEKARRHLLRTAVQEAVASVWRDATVKVYGSFATGLSTPLSALDLVCEDCADLRKLSSVAETLRENGVSVILHSDCFLRVESGGVTANISFVTSGSLARNSVALVRSWLAEFPPLAPAALVVRAVLSQARLDNPSTGGISAYALLAMAMHACRAAPSPPTGPDQALFAFLLLFGEKFDYAATAVDSSASQPVPRLPQHAADPVVVLDPLDHGNNLAAGCTRMPQIRSQLRYCLMALAKWDSNAGTRRGYKGRTPLSAVISHQWASQLRQAPR
eukprot:TRINITY_DN4088_c0_g1_i1.p1 TRINITY_DN4088_c0_g1~~TRINITY_DN4088_c0_g1_i1.p1  ORF type:complete len:441 (+),score=77.33 TRINITY_DN4088_c0_g1_i1:109-1431(+)